MTIHYPTSNWLYWSKARKKRFWDWIKAVLIIILFIAIIGFCGGQTYPY